MLLCVSYTGVHILGLEAERTLTLKLSYPDTDDIHHRVVQLILAALALRGLYNH